MDPAEGTIDMQFSSPGAVATSWSAARDELESAKTYWVTTVRPDGRPHSTTTAGVWLDDAVHFTTGASEVKAKNLAINRKVIVTVGCSDWEGLDIVIEGGAVSVTDPDRLGRLATAFTEKYDDFFGCASWMAGWVAQAPIRHPSHSRSGRPRRSPSARPRRSARLVGSGASSRTTAK
jgi:hypothetical protein